MPPSQPRTPALSPREREVAALVAEGLTNRQIAERLFISERTVDGHLEHLREKLAVSSRAQVATWFVGQSNAIAPPTRAPTARTRRPSRAVLAIGLAALLIVLVFAGVLALRPRTPTTQSVGTLHVVWDTNGAEYPFSFPGPIALGSDESIYVFDLGHDSVQKRDTTTGLYDTLWGGLGTGNGQFVTYCPAGASCPPACPSFCRAGGAIAVDREGQVWVLDLTGRVQVFNNAGVFQSGWRRQGTGPGELGGTGSYPGGIAFYSDGDVVISDGLRVQEFTGEGTYVGLIGIAAKPGGVAIDSRDDLYVAEGVVAGRILKYNSAGTLMLTIPNTAFLGAEWIATDRNDDLWVLEGTGNYLKKFDPNGHLLREWELAGFVNRWALAVAADGEVYVTDLPGGYSPESGGRLSKLTLH
jgi:DNA-binding CsgD family transcriptional regulator